LVLGLYFTESFLCQKELFFNGGGLIKRSKSIKDCYFTFHLLMILRYLYLQLSLPFTNFTANNLKRLKVQNMADSVMSSGGQSGAQSPVDSCHTPEVAQAHLEQVHHMMVDAMRESSDSSSNSRGMDAFFIRPRGYWLNRINLYRSFSVNCTLYWQKLKHSNCNIQKLFY
jgi:hypothetical protein